MKILHVITRLVRGGADENTLLSCNAQAEAGHEVILVYGAEYSKEMLQRLHPAAKPVLLRSLVRAVSPINDMRAFLEMAAIIRREKPDIVHTHTSKAGILGRAAARMVGARAVVHGVHILPFLNVGRLEEFIYLRAEKAVDRSTDAFVNVSYGMQTACLERGLGVGRHHVVPSGMDTRLFAEADPVSDDEVAATLGVTVAEARDMKIVLMVAALEPRKRQYEFLDVAAEVAKRIPNARFVLLGEGHDRDRIGQRAEQLGLADKVHLIGYRQDPQRWMKRADVCTLSSEREGLPRVVVQYALCARPIVVTHLPGVDDVVKQDQTGYLVPLDDLSAMTAPIVDILAEPALAERLSRNASAQDLSAWSVGSMSRHLEQIYSAILERKPEMASADR